MTSYISLLRGINVTGHRKITMKELALCFEKMGFASVRTYIQSGNVLFSSPETNMESLQNTIQKQIEKTFGYSDVTVFIIDADTMGEYINDNPFLNEPDVDLKRLYITFLQETPDSLRLESLNGYLSNADRFQVMNRLIYLYCPNGYGQTKLSNNFFENKLKVRATTRNWNTVNKLFVLASD